MCFFRTLLIAITAIAFALGVLLVAFLPSWIMVIVLAAVIIFVGAAIVFR